MLSCKLRIVRGMVPKLNPSPVAWPLGLTCSVMVFAAVWMLSQPGMPLFDARLSAVSAAWLGGLALAALAYRWRLVFGLWVHAALAVCVWTRLLAGLDDYRAQVAALLDFGGLQAWAADVLPLLTLALLASLTLAMMTMFTFWLRACRKAV
ncbi:hypothetical protein CAL22_14295 [Bordetella genomosp. 12]|uniref:Uncharacterized protein n=2 Tax=Bordetella genomosp. 12 TaxID=463035 RepID=A0A261VA68_9BORD|nr:hypothetical protein CAL22_14295 [Bordetella genomosp. 12]